MTTTAVLVPIVCAFNPIQFYAFPVFLRYTEWCSENVIEEIVLLFMASCTVVNVVTFYKIATLHVHDQ
ncbi:hypothetical protein S83_026000 [Arachis hypogaea]|uniref:Uncharacterized protein n=1 Tax=Arachis hypogaea TaxID=3818 RepID=A0A445BXQ2_ARAHY|nr:hypothetical protein Ahy_A08g039762 isoform B [Arachis hypogaea]